MLPDKPAAVDHVHIRHDGPGGRPSPRAHDRNMFTDRLHIDEENDDMKKSSFFLIVLRIQRDGVISSRMEGMRQLGGNMGEM